MPNEILQKWECVVEEIDKDIVYLRLYDLTEPNYDLEQAEVPIENFTEEVRSVLCVGRILYWTIEVDENGMGNSKFEPLLTKWTQEELDQIEKEADELATALQAAYK